MTRVPHAQGVSKAIRLVRIAAKKALKGVNRVASQRMARGDYATAETLAAKGKEIRQFETEVEALRHRWRDLCSAGTQTGKRAVTALWGYYQPILQALVQAGGECRRTEIEEHVGRLMASSFQAGDREVVSRGRERWRVMVQRARKPMVAERWIEDRSGKVWQITEAGRRTAEKPSGKAVSAS